MKTKTWAALLAALLAVCLGLSAWILRPREAATHAEIISNGKLLETVDLRISRSFPVETDDGYNVITIQDGKIAVTEASCPDHYCMHRGFCNNGAQIVCLPNKLVIQFSGKPLADAVVG